MLGYTEVRGRNDVVLYNLIPVIYCRGANISTLEIPLGNGNQVLRCVNYKLQNFKKGAH